MRNPWKSEEGDVVKLLLPFPSLIQRPFKTGLSYKYKITIKRGNMKPYPSENPSWCFCNSSDSLTKKVKSLGSRREWRHGVVNVQVRHNIKPHHNLSWRAEERTRILHGAAEKAIVLTEEVWHPTQHADSILTRATGQHAFMETNSVKNPVYLKLGRKLFLFLFFSENHNSTRVNVYHCFWNNGFIWGEFTMLSLKVRFWTSLWAICIPCMSTENL